MALLLLLGTTWADVIVNYFLIQTFKLIQWQAYLLNLGTPFHKIFELSTIFALDSVNWAICDNLLQ